MQLILALALVSVPVPDHRLEDPLEFKPFFSGEGELIMQFCSIEIPVVYSIYPGPSRLPHAIVIKCVPKEGKQCIEITCAGDNICRVEESIITAEKLENFINEWSRRRGIP